jgi:DNA polymerase-4
MEESTILHVNVTDFMAAVEEVRDPSLRGRPFVVGWQGRSRAIVLAVSGTAFQEGIRRGMLLEAARKKVRTLQVLSPAYEVYRRADARLAEVACRFSPVVELKGGGHLYLDLSGTRRLFGPPVDCAERVRKEIIQATDLIPALGLASAKVVSKVGTRVVRPSGFIAVPPGEERSFLAPLDVSLLPGVGARLLTRLHLLQIRTIGDLASLAEAEAEVLGPYGMLLRNRARGLDDRTPRIGTAAGAFPSRAKGASRLDDRTQRTGAQVWGTSSFPGGFGRLEGWGKEGEALSAGASLPEDANDPQILLHALRSLLFELGFTLRTRGLTAGSLRVQVVYTDGLQAQGTWRFPSPVTYDREMLGAAQALLPRVLRRRVRVRRIRCELGSLAPEAGQLDLYLSPWARDFSFQRETYEGKVRALQESLDRIRSRFGKEGIRPCADLLSPCTFLS